MKSIKKNSTKKNFMYNIIYQVLIVLFPFVTSPYISRVFGTEGLGIYSYRYSIANYFVIFAMLGLTTHGTRSIAIVRDDTQKLSKTFSNLLSTHLIVSISCILIYYIYVFCFVSQNTQIAIIEGIYVLSAVFDINWFFFGIERFDLTVTRNITVKVLSIIAIFVFVKAKSDLWKYAAIMSIGFFLSQVIVWIYIKRYIKFVKPTVKEIIKNIKPLLILFIPVIAVSLYKLMDKIILGYMSTMSEVGIFENAEKTNSIPLGVITALGTVMLPKMSNLFANGNKKQSIEYINISIQFVSLIASALTFGIMAVGIVFAPVFFGIDFTRSGDVIILLSPTILFIAWADVLRMQFLIPDKKDKVYIRSVIGGALVNLILNIVLIPKFGAMGSAIGTIGAEGTVFIMQAIGASKDLPLISYAKKCYPYIICGLMMYITVSALRVRLNVSIISLVLEVLVGVIVYSSSVIIYWYMSRDNLGKMVYEIIKKVSVNIFKKDIIVHES